MTNTWDTEAASASGFVPLARERPVSTEKKMLQFMSPVSPVFHTVATMSIVP